MNHPLIEQLLSGSGMLYLLKALLAVVALLLRQLSRDPFVRRRGLVVVALLAISALIQTQLGRIPERVSGFITLPSGEQISTLVSNPTFQLTSVTMLIISFLALVLLLTMLVDFLLVRKFKVESPNILRDVAAFTLFFFGVLMILYYRTDLDITGLFTTSAVISVVIGLALQDTLGNVFSGLALQTERSFNVGDWVQFGEFEGVVTDITWRSTSLRTWRSTSLRTRANDLVIIPNSVISKDTVINYSAPTRIHAIMEPIGVHYRHPPADVMAALEEASDHTEGILKRPRVDVRTYQSTSGPTTLGISRSLTTSSTGSVTTPISRTSKTRS
jgi:small-conductance mechanosensitive channel